MEQKQDIFILLDKNLERCLRIIHIKAENHHIDNNLVIVTHADMEKIELEQLRDTGCVEVSFNPVITPFESVCKLTYYGKHYFELKKQYKQRLRGPKIWEWIRYGITTLIALAALAVSIIALFTKTQ